MAANTAAVKSHFSHICVNLPHIDKAVGVLIGYSRVRNFRSLVKALLPLHHKIKMAAKMAAKNFTLSVHCLMDLISHMQVLYIRNAFDMTIGLRWSIIVLSQLIQLVRKSSQSQ